jgi:hypothetical protein
MASTDFHGEGKAVNSAPQKPTIEEMQVGLKSRHPRMTLRELQVAARVKTGMSASQIAAELGIAETTPIAAAPTPVWAWRTSVSYCLHKRPSEGCPPIGPTTPSCAVSLMAHYPTAQMLGAKVLPAVFVPVERAPARESRAECRAATWRGLRPKAPS